MGLGARLQALDRRVIGAPRPLTPAEDARLVRQWPLWLVAAGVQWLLASAIVLRFPAAAAGALPNFLLGFWWMFMAGRLHERSRPPRARGSARAE